MPEIHRDRLQEQLRRAGLNKTQLAAACGCSEDHIRSIQRGRRQPSIELVTRMAKTLRCKPADLLPPDVAVSAVEIRSPLRRRRIEAGLRAGDLAQRAGMSVTHLNNIEAGRKKPGKDKLDALAAALGCDPADILRDVA